MSFVQIDSFWYENFVVILRHQVTQQTQLPDAERVGDKFAVFRAAVAGRDDRRAPVVAAATCYHRTLTHVVERRAQFTSRERHQVEMTVLDVLYIYIVHGHHAP